MTNALYNTKIQLTPVDIHVGYLNADQIPQPVAIAAAIAGEAVGLLIVAVKIVVERIDVNESFGGQLNALREESEIFHARDDRVHCLANSLGEVAEQLYLDQLALGPFGSLLALAAMLAEHDHPLQIIDGPL